MTKTYAFCDTNAGLLQGIQTAETLDDAIRLHAAEVGLIEEISLDLAYAEVSESEAAALMKWSDSGCKSDFEPQGIVWHTKADDDVRETLGFAPRD